MLRQALPPLVAAYLVFAAMIAVASTRPVRRPRLVARAPDRATPREVLGTLLGGYVCFLAIVLVFHTWIGGEGDALGGAAWGGLFLSAIAVGMTAIRTAAAGLPWRRPRRRDG